MKTRTKILSAFAGAALAGAALAPVAAPAQPAEAITGTIYRLMQCQAGYEPAVKIYNSMNPTYTAVSAYSTSGVKISGNVNVAAGTTSGYIKLNGSYSSQQIRMSSTGSFSYALTCLA